VNRGTKAGGFNAPRTFPLRQNFGTDEEFLAALAAFNELIPFDEEVLMNYEAGFKLTRADGRLNFNGSVFYYDYDGYQAFTNNDANLLVRNVQAELTGAELEFSWRPVDPLTLSGFATYMADAEADDVELPSGEVADRRMPQTPDWSTGVSAAYAFQLGDFGVLTLSTIWKYNSEQFYTLFNTEADREESYTVGNVRATLAVGERFELAAFVNNVADEEYRIFVSDNVGFVSVIEENWGRPRWAGVSATFRFGE
jgi:iron complex outermembrane receptor protein